MTENDHDRNGGELSRGELLSELTDEERRVWLLEGFDDLPRFLCVAEAGKLLGVGRSTAYMWVNSGQLGSLSVGRCRRVPRKLLFDFVLQHLQYPAA